MKITKKFIMLLLGCLLCPAAMRAQMTSRHGVSHVGVSVLGGDTVQMITSKPVYCFARKADMRKYAKMIRDLKKVYPIAQIARQRMQEMEARLLELPDQKARKAYVHQVEKSIVKEYTPVLKHMTASQGRMLVKLIDRQTSHTSYEIVREFRGGFVAGFWQGVAKLFGQDLKDEYDAAERDSMLERLVLLYEADLL